MSADLSPAQLEQRRLAPVRHGLYVRHEDGRKLRDHRVRYRARKWRKSFPHLQQSDELLLLAAVRLSILVDDVFADLRAKNREGEPVPSRLRRDFERLQGRVVEYHTELRRRDEENVSQAPDGTAAILASLDMEGRDGE